jgi:PAS domain-containing protein
MSESAFPPVAADTPLPTADAGAAIALLEAADAMTSEELDALPYGMIQLDANGRILKYNAVESRLASLPQAHAVGQAVLHRGRPPARRSRTSTAASRKASSASRSTPRSSSTSRSSSSRAT